MAGSNEGCPIVGSTIELKYTKTETGFEDRARTLHNIYYEDIITDGIKNTGKNGGHIALRQKKCITLPHVVSK